MYNCKSRREFSDSHRGNGHTVTFEYDNLGRTKKVIYSGGPTLTYAYTGVLVVGYSYSAHGVVSAYAPLASVAAEPLTMNPLTYRGYIYDRETLLYYLQSRYYDPEMGRFINADAYASTGLGILGNNMFAYCQNSPVGFSDPYGYCAGSIAIPREGAAYTGLCPVCGACGGGSGGGGIPINLEKAATGITSAASKILVWTFEAVNFSAAASGTYVQDTTGLQKAKKRHLMGNINIGRHIELMEMYMLVGDCHYGMH